MVEKHADYCITAAKHENPTNHVASSFFTWMWKYNKEKEKWVWSSLGWKPAIFITEMIVNNNLVITGKEEKTTILEGSPVEIELRVKSNGKKYKISDLPDHR